jgi:hypothetical protein
VPGRDVFHENLNFPEIMKSGDSLLWIGQDKQLKVGASDGNESGSIIVSANAQGRLASARITTQAANFIEAERIAYDLIVPHLSYWSFLHDVAIDIAGFETIETRTQIAKYSFGSVGKIKAFDSRALFRPDSIKCRLLAAYREGMNDTNVFYQALSFYKVAEGINAVRKKASRRDAKAKGTTQSYSSERFPTDLHALEVTDELTKASFEPYLGQNFDSVMNHLKTVIRHAIAHLSQFEGALDADKYDDVISCLKAVPVLRYIAHKMLQNHLSG